MKQYYIKPNYCCGEGNNFTIADGQVVHAGLDAISVDGAGVVTIIEDWCGKFYNRRVDLREWVLVPDLPDGEYVYDDDKQFRRAGEEPAALFEGSFVLEKSLFML